MKNETLERSEGITICVRWQNPFFEAGAVEQQTTFQPGHLGRDFFYLTDGFSTQLLLCQIILLHILILGDPVDI